MPLSEKEERLRELGVDTFYIVEFDKEFAGSSARTVCCQILDRSRCRPCSRWF